MKNKTKKSKTYFLYQRFINFAYKKFGRLETRISLKSFSNWLDWREKNPDKEFWRFERFLS